MNNHHCPTCEVMLVNGVRCHELSCPNAWKDSVRECAWCGREFTPDCQVRKCCSPDCEEAYNL